MFSRQPSTPYPVIMTDDVESIEKTLYSINLTLQSNYKQLLTETFNFKIQINILFKDLSDCEGKIDFLLKSTQDEETINAILEIKEKIKPIRKQIQVFSHILSLQSFGNI